MTTKSYKNLDGSTAEPRPPHCPCCRYYLGQLADKERELEFSRGISFEADKQCRELQTKLTAAEAVVEAAKDIIKHSQTFGGNPRCMAPWQVKRARTDYGLRLDKLSAELDKLQGGL